MLTDHGSYPYRAFTERSDCHWPGGTRNPVYVGQNLGHLPELALGGPQPGVPNDAWRDYGNRVGAWRMRDLFDALDMPVSILANAAIYDHAPELMAAFRARGHEVVGQPYRLRHLRRALHHICAQRGEILLITSGAIHAYCRDSIPELIV